MVSLVLLSPNGLLKLQGGRGNWHVELVPHQLEASLAQCTNLQSTDVSRVTLTYIRLLALLGLLEYLMEHGDRVFLFLLHPSTKTASAVARYTLGMQNQRQITS